MSGWLSRRLGERGIIKEEEQGSAVRKLCSESSDTVGLDS